MKRLFFFLIILVSVIACEKSPDKNRGAVDVNIKGKWTYAEYAYSIGGPMEWYPVEPANQVIEFKEDGTFIPSRNFLPGANSYEKLDSVTLKFQPASTSSGYIKMGYNMDSVNGNLYLWPVEPMCIEGCSNKFVRKLN